MNVVRGLGFAELGDREVPAGLKLRQEEAGKGDRFASVLSRVARSANGEEASLPAEEEPAIRAATRMRDNRLSGLEGEEKTQDESVAGDTFTLLHGVEREVGMPPDQFEAKRQLLPDVPGKHVPAAAPEAVAAGATNLPHRVERQLGMLPNRLEAKEELLQGASEPGVLAVAPPADDEPATSVAAGLDFSSAAAAIAEIGTPDLLPELPGAGEHAPSEPPTDANAPLIAAAVGFRPTDLHEASPAAAAGEPPARHKELIETQGDRAPGESEIELRPTPTELPRVTVTSRETHFAPSRRPDPIWPAVLTSDPQSNPPDGPADGQAAGPEVPLSHDRFAQTGDLPWDEPGPQHGESRMLRSLPAGSAPSAWAAPTPIPASLAERLVAPPSDSATAGEGVSPRIVPPREFSRATAMSQEKPFAPARWPDPASPVTSDLQPEPPRSPEAAPASSRPETVARSTVPATEDQPPLPATRGPTPEVPQRHERGHQSFGVAAPAATTTISSTESALAPASSAVAPAFGAEVLQRISGAIVEAADSLPLTVTPAVAPAGGGNAPAASAPAQALTLRIDLHEHGAVHIRLALNGNALSLRVSADREETAEQLRQDHQQLSDTLSAAGYETEIVAIEGRKTEIAPLPGSDPASPAGTGANDAANTDRGTGGENRRSSTGRTQVPDQGFGEDFLPHDQEDHETRHIAQRRAGALYV